MVEFKTRYHKILWAEIPSDSLKPKTKVFQLSRLNDTGFIIQPSSLNNHT